MLKKNGVYIPDGKAITCMSSGIVGSGREHTRLWHLRLGHGSVVRVHQI